MEPLATPHSPPLHSYVAVSDVVTSPSLSQPLMHDTLHTDPGEVAVHAVPALVCERSEERETQSGTV